MATGLDSVTPKANAYFEIALGFAQELAQRSPNPDLAVGALRQVATHAVPVMGDYIHWVTNMLQFLMELLAPSGDFDETKRPFLTTLRDAIDQQLHKPKST